MSRFIVLGCVTSDTKLVFYGQFFMGRSAYISIYIGLDTFTPIKIDLNHFFFITLFRLDIFSTIRPCLDPLTNFYTMSHQMFGHIYKVLNIDEKITNYTYCV